MTEGWRKESAIDPRDLISAYADAPLAGLVITDIDSDIEDTEAQMGVIAALAEVARAPVIASGVVRSPDDVAQSTPRPHRGYISNGRRHPGCAPRHWQ